MEPKHDLLLAEPMRARARPASATDRRKVMLSMVFALALVVSAVASLNLALPDIARATGASQTGQQWLVDGYAVVFAGLLLPAGALGDRYGRRRMLTIGMLVFGLAYAMASLTTDVQALIACRAVAGVGAALTMPATLSIITASFPLEERSRAVGTWAGVAGGGAVIGLLLSGTLLEFASWRWVFAANAVWAAIALAMAARWAPESRDSHATSIDPIGGLLSAGGLSAAVYATIEGPHRGWGDDLVVGGFVAGAIGLIGFVLWELRQREPLLDPRLFRRSGFASGSLSIALQFIAFFGFIFIGLQYLQLVLGYTPLRAALAFVPMGMTIGALSRQVAPRLSRRVGGARTNSIGLAIASVGFCLLAGLGPSSSYWHVFAGIVTLGAGMGLATSPATSAIVASLPDSKQGVASAVNDAAREVGGAIGIAVLGSLLASGYHSGIEPATQGLPPEAAAHAHESLAFVVHAADQLGPAGDGLVAAAREAFVDGLQSAMWVAAAIMACGAAVTALIHRGDEVADAETGVPS
ncbi:MAG: MFS transporter [Acidimicrobiales bacterium]